MDRSFIFGQLIQDERARKAQLQGNDWGYTISSCFFFFFFKCMFCQKLVMNDI